MLFGQYRFLCADREKRHYGNTLVRIGTSGGLQPHVPIGTYGMVAEKSIGFDGVLNFYAGRDSVSDLTRRHFAILSVGIDNGRLLLVDADADHGGPYRRNEMVRG